MKESEVIKAMLEGKLIEQKQKLDAGTLKTISQFEIKFWDGVNEVCDIIMDGFCDSRINMTTRAALANSLQMHVKPEYHRYFYALYDSKNVFALILSDIHTSISRRKDLNDIRYLFNDVTLEKAA